MKALKSFMITLVIVIVIGCLFIVARAQFIKKSGGSNSAVTQEENSGKKSKANPVTKAIVNEALDTYIDNTSNEKVKEIAGSMSEEDKDAVTEIIANNVNIDDIPEVKSIISSGDTSEMIEYAEENLSEEEVEELKEIMSKYVTP